jgi:hypothetical protein
MFISSACVLIILMLFLLFRIKTNRRNYLLSKIPSPKKTFLLHNLPLVFGTNPSELAKKFEHFYSVLGDVIHATFHPLDCGIVFVSDHEIAKVLSINQPDRARSLMYEFLSEWVGKNGLFLSSGFQQKSRLKFALFAFNPKFHKAYMKKAFHHYGVALKNLKTKEIIQMEISQWISNVILDFSFGI